MSTNKTPNYSLHAWEPDDEFLRAEINENFADIDGVLSSKAELITGVYVGNGAASRTFELGRRILAVLVEYSVPNSERRGLALPALGFYSNGITVTGTSFNLSNGGFFDINHDGYKYIYLAFVE